MEYPVGSIVVVVKSDREKHLVGLEATITEPVGLRWDGEDEEWYGYCTDLICDSGVAFTPPHEYVRLKQLPPSSEFDSFMSKLKEPLPLGELLKVKFGEKKEV